jgi:dTDP-4-amino-4,6-dideoxygalactose transaminase
MIPMINLKKQFEGIRDEVLKSLTEVLESTQYILGPKVKEFERKISEYHGVSEAVGVASGTDALHLSLTALGIGSGDEVITTPFTFFATVEAILYTGARPVFVDIEPDTFNIAADKIEEKITNKTKAILPVHMFGHPADMEKIMDVAKRHNLKVVEDCAQAFGASVNGKKVGSFGDTGCFSFYPSKNLGACGDGGMIVLNDRDLAGTLRGLRNHGSKGAYVHERIGFNSRLDELQAAILLVKLKVVDKYNSMRREKAELYNRLLAERVVCPKQKDGFYHVYHQYTIRSPKRDEIQRKLKEAGIASTVYYPLPLHLQSPLSFAGYKKGDFPAAEKAAEEVLSLPICPELENSAIERIAEIIASV